MREFQSLKFLSLFKGIFTRMGVDYAVMEKILRIKLTMDERRVPTIFAENGKKKKEGNQFLKSLWIYGLYSLILIPFLLLGENYIYQVSIVFGMILFILMTSMTSVTTPLEKISLTVSTSLVMRVSSRPTGLESKNARRRVMTWE